MVTEPTLTICLDASEICELASCALRFLELVSCDIACPERVALATARGVEFAR